MPLNIPSSNPLTTSQAEVTAKIGSMKNLLSLPSGNFKNIPKKRQVSTFDYLLKIFNSLGISPQIVFQLFFTRILDVSGNLLENAVVEGLAVQLTFFGVRLPGETFDLNQASPEIRSQITQANKLVIQQRLQSAGLTNFLQTAKQQIAKDLALALFGPKDGPAAEYLNPNPAERQRIIENAICAVDAFTLSNNAFIRNEDTEFNRIALARQLERGEVVFEISCQKVKIKLPDDPSWIFEGGGQQTIQSTSVTPAQSITQLATYVESVTQQINNQANAKDAGKTFWQIMIEGFISNATNLIFPFVGPLLSSVQNDIPNTISVTPENLITNTCEILNETSGNPQKKMFGEKLVNMLLKELLSFMLIFAIREFKKLVRNYFARISREKAKRKAARINNKFKLSAEASIERAEKAARYAKALESLEPILSGTTPL